MDFVPLAAAVALIWKIVDFAKQVRVRDWDSVVTQAVTWGAGVAVGFILAHSDFGSSVPIAGTNLGHMNSWSVVLVGLTIASTGSVAYDYKRALDRSDSAAMPSLVSGLKPVAVIDPPAGHTTASKATTKHTHPKTP